ncbi:MAG: multidrug effflux MFS transporter [Rhodospirillaceae bacterium]|jgi:DHA1 family bicyclomycin/chloramphenicol resistance-like MFS transporter|nr:multidrug effflux MFS transporter [Rhodospirillaceae bacterium]MBT3809557.1 multidrug effflux MFS transporter [Rhodospirillaceae bacterium]MBT3929526.1 multidrug effflux MFS transporter [Rhodospirillaceae bacterium]MBT4773714.1 multidrug effflux MFS transporter [Rhodospirillaceae bacterium]MBT5357630.1 multidrug effflux MFS transporter [Rhodospirillaceae bacterium]
MALRKSSLAVLFAMMFSSQLALTIFLPAVPDIARDLNTSLGRTQLIIPAYLIAFAFMQLIVGPLSDRFGRRPVIMSGVALFMLASLACAFATDIWQLLGGRFFQAAGACASIVVGRATVRDTSDGKAAAQAMSYVAISLGVGPAVAPLIGAELVEAFNWRATFLATAVVSGLSLLVAIPVLRETLPPHAREKIDVLQLMRGYLALFRRAGFMGYSLTISFQSAIFQVFMTAAPIVLIIQLGVTPKVFGLYLMVIPIAFITGSFVSGRLVRFLPVDLIVGAGCTMGVLGGVLQVALALTDHATPTLIVVAILISNFGTGLVLANCYAQALNTVPPSFAGAASALSGCLHMGWAFTMSLIVANLPHSLSLQMGIAQTATTVLSLSVFLFVVRSYGRRGG